MSVQLKVRTVGGESTGYTFRNVEDRAKVVAFVSRLWKTGKNGILRLTNPTGVAVYNVQQIVWIEETDS